MYERYRQQTDRQTTDGRATAYSEREHEFTFAKNGSRDRQEIGQGKGEGRRSNEEKRRWVITVMGNKLSDLHVNTS